MKNKKILITILFLIFLILNFNTSLASTYNQKILSVDSNSRNGIELFPESYKKELNKLVEKTGHYNWKFRPFYTDISWNEVTSNKNENKCLKNTIRESAPAEWKCTCSKKGDKGFVCASKDIINYYLDARNFLTEKTIFQFLDLSNKTKVTESQIREAVAGTYLEGSANGVPYSKMIYDAAEESGEGAFSIISRIFQELGIGKELPYMISGKDPDYPGVYNFFNYGATDGEGNIKRGLEYAKKAGWTTPQKALVGGAKLVADSYLNAGQVNKYLYKFDVVGNEYSELYKHQYMTNVEDQNSQALLLHNIYNNSGLIDKGLTFIIPVYKDMPAFVKRPHHEDINKDLYYVSSNYDSVYWRDAPNGNRKPTPLVKDTVVTMLQANIPNVKSSNGYNWAKIMQNGVEGYMSMEYLSPVNRVKDKNQITETEKKYLGKNKKRGLISYKAQLQDIGWTGWANDGESIGTEKSNRRLETIRIELPEGLKIEKLQYRVHVQEKGWMNWVSDGGNAGTIGESKRIEAIQMKLREGANYDILYRVCIEGEKWTDWMLNGKVAGTVGESKPITAIQVKIKEKNPIDNEGKQYKGTNDVDNNSLINYNTYLQNAGWSGWISNGKLAGSEGQKRKIEGIKIKLSDKIKNESIQYRAHIQDVGWTDWKKDGEIMGKPESNKRIEAIQIKLKNGNKYDLKYRVHVQDIGWMNWVNNGEIAGTEGKFRRIEAIEISLKEKEKEKINLSYKLHVQERGWMNYVGNGALAGTVGQSKRAEAIKINIKNDKGIIIPDAIKYQVHVQERGWMNWVNNGEIAGTEGQSKRIEAIEIMIE